jgi:hypothetical protein
MKRYLRGFAAGGSLFLAMFTAEVACAQKQGGILKMYSPDSPASMSIHEEATVFAEGPMMATTVCSARRQRVAELVDVVDQVDLSPAAPQKVSQ